MVQDAQALTDDWLSAEIDRPAFRVKPSFTRGELDRLPKSGIFAYAKVDVADVASVRRLEDLGFRVVDCGVFLRQRAAPEAGKTAPFEVRKAVPGDEEAVAAIARDSFEFSRFHLDPSFTKETADRVKESWVRNFFRGKRGDALFVVVDGGRIAGFSQMLKDADGWIIDLIAVGGAHRGKGAGRALIAGLNRELGPLSVGTQVANAPSLRLYARAGFEVVSSQYVLHLHR
jgi:ribosomal protein S18 acetylase RimI-like enzyme